MSTWFKALEDKLLFYIVELNSISMMLFILLNLIKISLISNIFVGMDMILKLWSDGGNECLFITLVIYGQKSILWKFPFLLYVLYQTTIKCYHESEVM